MVLRGKATVAKAGELIAILRDLLLSARLDQRERLRRLVLEEKAQLESNLVPMGSYYCGLRLKAAANESGFANEQMYGVSQLAFSAPACRRDGDELAGSARTPERHSLEVDLCARRRSLT